MANKIHAAALLVAGAALLALWGCSGKYYEKQVVFPPDATAEQKVDMASRLVPMPRQLAWQKLEMTAFLHFGINTFTGSEWGTGKEDPSLFNPKDFNAGQWAKALKEGGFKMAILTAKHHDGFCLWPTAATRHSVAASEWRGGKGDVVKEVKAACDKAHALGMKVAAHVESPQGVRVALEGGVDTIEHGAAPDEEILRLFKERHACHIATISPALPYAMFDRSVTGASETEQYNGRLVMDGIINCAKACLKNGIPVGLGTDTGCPYITHYDMWREVYYFHKLCNVSNAFALHTATLGNARLVGLGEETGSLEPGKCADLVVTGGNPLEDLKALRHMDLVMARGNLYRSPKVKKMEKAERELDKFL